MSCFDQRLAEDTSVNRLEDSLLIWKYICNSKLLARIQLILYVNLFIFGGSALIDSFVSCTQLPQQNRFIERKAGVWDPVRQIRC